MSAMPNTNPGPGSNRDIIQRFREAYGAALADARVSSEHTHTEGWQKLYRDHQQFNRSRRADMAKRLKLTATALEDFGLTEDGEKLIKEIAKESADLRAANTVFEREAIERVREPVLACERVVTDHVNEATRAERDAPLHNVGLEEKVRLEARRHAKPRWNPTTGVVEIMESGE